MDRTDRRMGRRMAGVAVVGVGVAVWGRRKVTVSRVPMALRGSSSNRAATTRNRSSRNENDKSTRDCVIDLVLPIKTSSNNNNYSSSNNNNSNRDDKQRPPPRTTNNCNSTRNNTPTTPSTPSSPSARPRNARTASTTRSSPPTANSTTPTWPPPPSATTPPSTRGARAIIPARGRWPNCCWGKCCESGGSARIWSRRRDGWEMSTMGGA
mmetsp:Transcript_21301/g.45013  ORF Transcript_21301/g.45013 Transcript_21301/m.45013 type:complete len:210 (+) Transcript_21301:972-1601(+)